MRQYWQSLQTRERFVLTGGAGLLLLLLFYLLVLEPWQRDSHRLQQRIATQQETLQWMQQAAVEVVSLRGNGALTNGQVGMGGQSLMGSIDSSARAAGIAPAIRQIRPDPQGVTVRLENAAFDDALRWLGSLYREQAIQVGSFTMERLPEVGRVNISVSLSR